MDTIADHGVDPYDQWQRAATSPWATLSQEEILWGLEQTRQRVARCTRCPELVGGRTKTVFSSGRAFTSSGRSPVCLVGEAPGYHEDQSGEPFVGEAGELLTKILSSIGLSREEVYICNVLKCRPPHNRRPLPDEVSHCHNWLTTQLRLVRPSMIVCLGSTAAYGVLGKAQSVGSLRGNIYDFESIPVLCTYHPAYLLRNPEAKRDVWTDMKRVQQLLQKPLEGSLSHG